jgi:mono/diheme cytochrome c family protein
MHSAVVASQSAARTVWDGVYTAAQATRGEPVYKDKCAKCHAAELTGLDAPPLVGAGFSSNWNDLSVYDLSERIRVGMPDDAKGSLTREQVADLVAYMLQRAEMPAGKAELPTQADALKAIKYLGSKP